MTTGRGDRMAKLSVVVVDSRERNMEIYDYLRRNGYEPLLDKLDVGDIMTLGDVNFLIERKTESDFVSSLVSGRLFTQMRNLADNAEILSYVPVLLFIGSKPKMWKFRKIKPYQLAACFNAIQFKMGISIIDVHNEIFAGMRIANLIDMYDPEKDKAKKVYPIRTVSKKNLTDEEFTRCVLEGLPAIGAGRAKQIVDKFGSLKKCFDAIDSGEVKEIKGIGEKVHDALKRIYK